MICRSCVNFILTPVTRGSGLVTRVLRDLASIRDSSVLPDTAAEFRSSKQMSAVKSK
jgi:hypothetical protein